MQILIIGCGYVGLVTAACFAEQGHVVTCLDIDEEKVASLQKGVMPFYEPGLEELVQRNIAAQRLSFTIDYKASLSLAQICFITVNTPSMAEGQVNLYQLEKALISLAQHMQHPLIIAIKSTVPVGTAAWASDLILQHLRQRGADIAFDVISNPEFLREGNAIHDFLHLKRVVIGTDNPEVVATLKELYQSFMQAHDNWFVVNTATAELSKYVANAMLATRISFINEMAGLCEHLGARIDFIHAIIGSDPRIGKDYLHAGVGYGGSCLNKDVQALKHQADALLYPLFIMDAVDAVNKRQKEVMAHKIHHYFKELKNRTIGILGLAFKPDTDDMREAPSLNVIGALLQEHVSLRLFDPVAMHKARHLIDSPLVHWCQTELEAAEGVDALVFMTEWKQFRLLDFTAIRKKMKGNAIFDGRNQFSPEKMAAYGFDYISIGR